MRASHGSNRPCDQVRPLRPALLDPQLLGIVPAKPDQGLSREMHDRIHAFELLPLDQPRIGIPQRTPFGRFIDAPDQAHDLVTPRGQDVTQRPSDEAARAGDGDLQRLARTIALPTGEIAP